MAARAFFTWRIFADAKAQDDRNYNARKEARARACFEPLLQLTERQFKDKYRFSKKGFKFLRKELRRMTNLRSSQRVSLEHKAINDQRPQSQPTQMVVVEFCHQDEPGNVSSSPLQPPSQGRAVSSPPLAFVEEDVHRFQPWNEPGPSTAAHVAPAPTTPQKRSPLNSFVEQQVEGQEMLTPARPFTTSPVRVVRPEPALSGQTTPRRVRPTITRGGASRRRVGPTPAHTEQAAQHFLQADEYWRKFKLQQHRDYTDIRREQNRIRELEVQATMGWQAIGSRILDSLEKIVDKYCKDNYSLL